MKPGKTVPASRSDDQVSSGGGRPSMPKAASHPGRLKAYELGVYGYEGHPTVINAETAGKAKSRYLHHHLDDCGVSYTEITCRCLGAARPPAPTRTEIAQRECDAFNAQHPVGTPLRYWSWLHEGEPTGVGLISHPASVMCESAVIWVQGVHSCHSLTHVEPVPAQASNAPSVDGLACAAPGLPQPPKEGTQAPSSTERGNS